MTQLLDWPHGERDLPDGNLLRGILVAVPPSLAMWAGLFLLLR